MHLDSNVTVQRPEMLSSMCTKKEASQQSFGEPANPSRHFHSVPRHRAHLQARYAVAGFVPGSLGVPEGGGGEAAPVQVPEPNAEAAARLTDMGFPEAVARRALLLTRNRLDAATEWCLSSATSDGSCFPKKNQTILFREEMITGSSTIHHTLHNQI